MTDSLVLYSARLKQNLINQFQFEFRKVYCMDTLVEEIVSLENEADSIVAAARHEAHELEKSVMADVETYRRKLSEDMETKVSSFQKEVDTKHKAAVIEAEAELVRALGAVDRIADHILKKQIDRIVGRFSEI
jgi:vacuolar-type H+-ATPase subunit H